MKADELWEKYYYADEDCGHMVRRDSFLAALAEYGQAVRDRDAEIARKNSVSGDPQEWISACSDCADAIDYEPLP